MSNLNAAAPRKTSRATWIVAGIVGFLVIVHLIPNVRAFEAGFVKGFMEGFMEGFTESYEKARAGR